MISTSKKPRTRNLATANAVQAQFILQERSENYSRSVFSVRLLQAGAKGLEFESKGGFLPDSFKRAREINPIRRDSRNPGEPGRSALPFLQSEELSHDEALLS